MLKFIKTRIAEFLCLLVIIFFVLVVIATITFLASGSLEFFFWALRLIFYTTASIVTITILILNVSCIIVLSIINFAALIRRRGGKIFGVDYRGGWPSTSHRLTKINLDEEGSSNEVFKVIECKKYRKDASQKYVGQQVKLLGRGNGSYVCECADKNVLSFSHSELETPEGYVINGTPIKYMSYHEFTKACIDKKDVWLLKKDRNGAMVTIGGLLYLHSISNYSNILGTFQVSLLLQTKKEFVIASKEISFGSTECSIFDRLYSYPPEGARIVEYL